MTGIPRIAVTSGEPAGIGPDLCLQPETSSPDAELVILGDAELMSGRARQLGLAADFDRYDSEASPRAGATRLEPVAAAKPVEAGRLDPANAHYVLSLLDRAIDGCLTGEFDAMVTCPIQKSVINEAGIAFTGHTEYLAERTHAEQVVMLLSAPRLRVALATTHLPLSQVAARLDTQSLTATLRSLHHGLVRQLGIARPTILVAGLNPHAGEDGHLGDEETTLITPVIERLRREGMLLEGPLPADTLFTPPYLERADAVLAMYHDQGLPVLKHIGFGRAVNITLGLPIIRTSVDHGTALSLAGTGRAETGSLVAAIQTALDMLSVRRA